jgi:hypothetical protein
MWWAGRGRRQGRGTGIVIQRRILRFLYRSSRQTGNYKTQVLPSSRAVPVEGHPSWGDNIKVLMEIIPHYGGGVREFFNSDNLIGEIEEVRLGVVLLVSNSLEKV